VSIPNLNNAPLDHYTESRRSNKLASLSVQLKPHPIENTNQRYHTVEHSEQDLSSRAGGLDQARDSSLSNHAMRRLQNQTELDVYRLPVIGSPVTSPK